MCKFWQKIRRKYRGFLSYFVSVFTWLGVFATIAAILMIVVIIVDANAEYDLLLTLAGIDGFVKFWSGYGLVLKILASGITLVITGYTLTHALHLATINSLKDLRERFNESGKKSFMLFLMKSYKAPDDSSDSNLAERIASTSSQLNVPVMIENQISFNSTDVLDYFGVIELGGLMLKRGLITIEEFYNQFGYRLEYVLANQQIVKHIYNDAEGYYKDLHWVIDLLKNVGLLKESLPVEPGSIYKYYTIRQHNIDAFKNNQIFFSRPSKLNDPFDTTSRQIEPYKKFCKRIGWNPQMANLMDNHGICSFTESNLPDNKHLWTLYADSFRGYALEFDRDLLTEGLPRQFRMPVYLQKVIYDYKPFNLDDFNSKFRLNGEDYTLRECIKDYPAGLDRVFQYLHLYKDYDVWHLEKESRLIAGNLKSERFEPVNRDGYLLTMPEGAVTSLTLGGDMPENYREELVEIAKQRRIPVYIATPEIIDGQWTISIQKYQNV